MLFKVHLAKIPPIWHKISTALQGVEGIDSLAVLQACISNKIDVFVNNDPHCWFFCANLLSPYDSSWTVFHVLAGSILTPLTEEIGLEIMDELRDIAKSEKHRYMLFNQNAPDLIKLLEAVGGDPWLKVL